jgi:hypothetical protein
MFCLSLLFFEAVFGICAGCKIYNFFHKKHAKYCPGNTCDLPNRTSIQRLDWVQIGILILTILVILYLALADIVKVLIS